MRLFPLLYLLLATFDARATGGGVGSDYTCRAMAADGKQELHSASAKTLVGCLNGLKAAVRKSRCRGRTPSVDFLHQTQVGSGWSEGALIHLKCR